MKKHSENRRAVTGGGRLFLLLFLSFALTAAPASAAGRDSSVRGGPPFADWSLQNWAVAFGGADNEEIQAMAASVDGGLILAGSSWSFEANQGYSDAWVVKLDPGDEIDWETITGESLWDRFSDLDALSGGGYAVAGTRYPPGGSQEAWAMKLDSEGEIEWENTYGRPEHYDGAIDIEEAADGGLLLLGWTQSYAVGSARDAWVLKLSSDGALEWELVFGGDALDSLFAADRTADGGFILAGGTYSYANVPYFSEVWLVKISSEGEVEWETTYGGPFNDVAYDVHQSADGGYVLAAWTSMGRGDAWVLKTDSSGNLQWEKRFGGDWQDVPTSLRLTGDGGLLLAGYTYSFGQGLDDGWVLKLTGDGRIEWQKTFGGDQGDRFQDIVETALGYAATGYTESFGAGTKDGWCVHFTRAEPGMVLLKGITGRSNALSPSMELQVNSIESELEEIDTSPRASITRTSQVFSTVTDLSELPGREGPAHEGVERRMADHELPWPIRPESRR